MFNFLKKKFSTSTDLQTSQEKEKRDNGATQIGVGYTITNAAQDMTQATAKKFAKPATYTGNRTMYDSGAAKRKAKEDLFKSGKPVKDPYTGKDLVLTKKEAKALYGEDWASHLAESDHVKPLERIYNDTKNNQWNTTDDIRAAANNDDNIQVSSRKFNNAKRSRSNEEFVTDDEYLQSKQIELSEKGKKQAIKDGKRAERSINAQLRKASVKNIAKVGHEAGKYGAENAGVTALTMSGIMNVVSVIKGEKSSEDAIADTLVDGGEAAVSGYVMSGGMTVVSHTLAGSSSEFIQGLVKSNVPGTVITAAIVTGGTLKKWGEGKITTQECLLELGDKGLNMAVIGEATIMGQAAIPIPIVGGAVGALVGSVLTSECYNMLIDMLRNKVFEHEERMRIIKECHEAAEQTRAFRKELQQYLDAYFTEYQNCFDMALSSMRFSFASGDADGVIASANEITRKLGGTVQYESVDEFREFLDDDDSVDIF